jgi:hypothetical protein
MPTAEYHCRSCGAEYEYVFAIEDWPYPDACECARCGLTATRYFSYAPAMSPDPMWNGYFDVQLGQYISSRDEKKRILKEKGLEEVSANEHRRGFEGYSEKEDVIPKDDPKFRAAMEKAWADMKAGNLEPVTPRKVDVSDATVVS